jgi:hypothetical protein
MIMYPKVLEIIYIQSEPSHCYHRPVEVISELMQRNCHDSGTFKDSGGFPQGSRPSYKIHCHCSRDSPVVSRHCLPVCPSMNFCRYDGRMMAQSLSSAGISTFLVPDSSIYVLMSRVNKVIIGAHAILANGGMFATSGSLIAATAARAHHTPVVVCAGQFKLTPFWNLYHAYGSLDFGNPDMVLGFEEGHLVDKVDVVNPFYDYVKPELIDAFITNE